MFSVVLNKCLSADNLELLPLILLMTVSDNLASFGVAYFQSFIFFSASSSVFLFEFRACVYFIICREGKRKIDIHHSFLVFLFCSTNVFPFQFSFPAQP